MIARRIANCLAGVALALCGSALAEDALLFDTDAPLVVELRAPFTRIHGLTPDQAPRESAGQATFRPKGAPKAKFKVRIQQRGNLRRRACSLPPLRLNFVKKETAGTLLDGQNKLKLVGVCERQSHYRRFVMLELFSYRAFSLLTPASFDTRLLELRYIDTAGDDSMRRPGFVIEDVDDLADRLGYEELGVAKISPSELDRDAAALVELFALMIGNTDFSTVRGPAESDCCHNVKLLSGGADGIIPVPYDFDSAGIVDPPYAAPSEKLPIEDVRTRYFNGICKAPEHFEQARAVMLAQKDGVMALFEDHEGLSNKVRSKTVRYVRDFFAMLESDEAFERDVITACVGPGSKD